MLPQLNIQSSVNPVLELIDEASGELVYCLRLTERSWQPHAFAPGKYTVRLSVPEQAIMKELKGLEAKAINDAVVEVIFS